MAQIALQGPFRGKKIRVLQSEKVFLHLNESIKVQINSIKDKCFKPIYRLTKVEEDPFTLLNTECFTPKRV